MRRSASLTMLMTVGALTLGFVAFPGEVLAGRRFHRYAPSYPERTSFALKAGVYSPDADGASDGFFGGLEYAAQLGPTFELGIGADYFYRARHGRAAVVDGEGPYDIPVHGELSPFESSTHLGALGGLARIRVPTSPDAPSPFVEGGLAVQLLHLRAPAFDNDGTISDTFAGWGWHLGAGLDVPVNRNAALLGELGWNHAEPTNEERIDGSIVTFRANASGAYGRLGIRFYQ